MPVRHLEDGGRQLRLGYPCAIPRHCLALRDDYHPSIHPNGSIAIRYHHRGKTRATCASLVIR